ncbi:MAG: response regulator [Elusimicrobiota bacterium]|nr:response regulator [Elusimicrobiota bacterium]
MVQYKILLVDDDPDIREYVRMALKNYDTIRILEAVDGNKAVVLAKHIKPDLILLDNKMPSLSGESVAKNLKNDPLTRDIPVVMITAMRLSRKEIELIKLDVDDYIEKPISTWQLENIVKKYIPALKGSMDTVDIDDDYFDDGE